VERAAVGAKIANLKLGDNQHAKEGPPIGGPSVSNAEAAKLMDVSERTIEHEAKLNKASQSGSRAD
jgi:hypothetical protein